MTPQDNKRLVRRYYDEVLNGRNEALLHDLLAPDFCSRFGADVEVDAAGYARAVHRYLEAFPDLRVELLAQVAEGDLVATRWRAWGTKNGQPLQLSVMHFHRVADGRLAEHWEELDPRPLL